MKDLKWFYKWSLLALLLGMQGSLFAKEFTSFSKPFTTQAPVRDSDPIKIKNRYGDVVVKVWDKQEVKVEAQITGEIEKSEDFDEFFAGLTKGILMVDETVLVAPPIARYNQSVIMMGTRQWGKSELELDNHKKYKLEELRINMVVYVPNRHQLSTEIKYNDLQMDSYKGDVWLNQYNGNAKLGTLEGDVSITAKYSSVQMTSGSRVNMTLYDGSLHLGKADDLTLTSKYSKVELAEMRTLRISSFDDNIQMGSATSLDYRAKYSSIEGKDLDRLSAEIYDGKLEFGNVAQVSLAAKYADIGFKVVETLSMSGSYDNQMKVESIVQCSIGGSKYSKYEIGIIKTALSMDSYDDKMKINDLPASFKNLNISAKYSDFDLTFAKTLNQRLTASLKYGDLDLPKSHYTIDSRFGDSNDLTLKATVGKGQPNPASVVISAYSSQIKIRIH